MAAKIIVERAKTMKKIKTKKALIGKKNLFCHFLWKLSTLSKNEIISKLINFLKFGFDLIKSPEIYYKKQLRFEKFGISLTPNFASQKGQHEWNTLYIDRIFHNFFKLILLIS